MRRTVATALGFAALAALGMHPVAGAAGQGEPCIEPAPATTAPVEPCPTSTTSLPASTTSSTAPDDSSTSSTAPVTVSIPGDEEIPTESASYYAAQPTFSRRSSPMSAALYEAQARLEEATAMRDTASASVASLTRRLADLEVGIGALEGARRSTAEQLITATDDAQNRAVEAYMRGQPQVASVVFGADDASDVLTRLVLLDQVLLRDQQAVDLLQDLTGQAAANVRRLVAEYRDARGRLEGARIGLILSELVVAEAEIEVSVWESLSDVYIEGFLFPVARDYSFIDSWGFPRMVGTPLAHWHEGTDIFAPTGTELIAVENGVISKLSEGGLGGMSVHLTGESGHVFYYAHLSARVDGLTVGDPVMAGDVIGFVGDTGNARGGTPHLHFEIRPAGGRPVNPYPILAVAAEQAERRARELATAQPDEP